MAFRAIACSSHPRTANAQARTLPGRERPVLIMPIKRNEKKGAIIPIVPSAGPPRPLSEHNRMSPQKEETLGCAARICQIGGLGTGTRLLWYSAYHLTHAWLERGRHGHEGDFYTKFNINPPIILAREKRSRTPLPYRGVMTIDNPILPNIYAGFSGHDRKPVPIFQRRTRRAIPRLCASW